MFNNEYMSAILPCIANMLDLKIYKYRDKITVFKTNLYSSSFFYLSYSSDASANALSESCTTSYQGGIIYLSVSFFYVTIGRLIIYFSGPNILIADHLQN